MTSSPEDEKFLELKEYIPMLDLLLSYLTSKEPDNSIVKKVKNILNTLNFPKTPPSCDLTTLERIESVVKTLKVKMAPKLKEFERQQSLQKQNKTSHVLQSSQLSSDTSIKSHPNNNLFFSTQQ
ncbi:uncharacterized protein LOC113466134 [Diaphorina citri]|uniref:Uncharacterized protein LOC113466134 n=1 Tax=Diaphorina citri TaxID=121845 RepID=A0A3Q0ILB7_DIACI|nr:uncharacterized protein LOC113466134 [Diaphorina citri]